MYSILYSTSKHIPTIKLQPCYCTPSNPCLLFLFFLDSSASKLFLFIYLSLYISTIHCIPSLSSVSSSCMAPPDHLTLLIFSQSMAPHCKKRALPPPHVPTLTPLTYPNSFFFLHLPLYIELNNLQWTKLFRCRMIWLLPHPPSPHSPVSKMSLYFSVFVCVIGRPYWRDEGMRVMGWGGGGSKSPNHATARKLGPL